MRIESVLGLDDGVLTGDAVREGDVHVSAGIRGSRVRAGVQNQLDDFFRDQRDPADGEGRAGNGLRDIHGEQARRLRRPAKREAHHSAPFGDGGVAALLVGLGGGDVGEALVQDLQFDVEEQSGQRCAEARVDPLPETEVRVLNRAIEVDDIRVREVVRVSRPCSVRDEQTIAGDQLVLAEHGVLGDESIHPGDRRLVADQLLQRTSAALVILLCPLPQCTVREQVREGHADEIRRGLMAGQHEAGEQ